MWAALRKFFGFLLSRTTVIVLVCVLVVLGLALWFFAERYLEDQREQVAEARANFETLEQQVKQRAGEVERLAQDREALEAKLAQAQNFLFTERERLNGLVAREKQSAEELKTRIEEGSKAAQNLSKQLEKLLGPFAETDWIPDFVQDRAKQWRAEIAELNAANERMVQRKDRALEQAKRFGEQVQTLVQKTTAENSTAQLQLEQWRAQQADLQQQLTPEQEKLAQERQQLAGLEQSLTDKESTIGRFTDSVRRAWDTVKWFLLGLALAWLFGPLILRAALFYLWAPLLHWAPPVRMEKEPLKSLQVGESAPARKIWLQPGEVAIVHERFLQSSDEPLKRRTQWLWRWRYPFTSLAAGMALMTRLHHAKPDTSQPKSEDAQENSNKSNKSTVEQATPLQPAQITLSSQESQAVELAIIELPEGARLACRPRFIAGMIQDQEAQPVIESRWVFFRLHSWVTLQFRHFIFHGPVRIVLAAGRGIQVEELRGGSRRTNEDLTIAFEPWLDYRSRRCETFIAYLRGHNPLFDDLFEGKGTFLAQQVRSHDGKGGKKRNFWESFFGLFFKALGL